MLKLIKTLIAGVAVSFYFFPFEFTFLPGVNTKMAMAGLGVVLYLIELAKGNTPKVDKNWFVVIVISALVSLCGLLAAFLNNTNDYSYAAYIVSMFVWIGGAFTAVKIVKWLHGYVSVELIANYLIGVCVGQCVLSLLIDSVPTFKAIVDRYVVGFDFVDTDTLSQAHRLYGIGAGLDVAGTRFAAVLVIIAAILQNLTKPHYKRLMWLYITAFIIISVVGNMIARTTTVGMVVSGIYWVVSSGTFKMTLKINSIRIWRTLIVLLLISLPVIISLYSLNEQFHDNIRFAFEGFFSIAETGRWETNSNNMLKEMIVFPDNIQTWLIGDGYILNPYKSNPYYVGEAHGGYYMDTDIGYLRFIFYFGLIGLLSFVAYFIKVTKTCSVRFMKHSTMFVLILIINMLVWIKVSTDLFLVFAIFLCISKEENDAYEREYEDSIPDSLDV